jgi:hypothetical protein
MKTARNKPTAANLRSWRVTIIRSKGEYLGSKRPIASRPKLWRSSSLTWTRISGGGF